MALEDVGFNIDTFNDPSLALENFQPNLYDFIILDIVMPKMGGFELYKQLKKVDPGVKVCFLTASVMYDEKLRKEEYCDLDKFYLYKTQNSIPINRE